MKYKTEQRRRFSLRLAVENAFGVRYENERRRHLPQRIYFYVYSKLGQRRDTPVSRALSAGPARSKSITVVDIAFSFFFSFFPCPLSFGVYHRLLDQLSTVVTDGQDG